MTDEESNEGDDHTGVGQQPETGTNAPRVDGAGEGGAQPSGAQPNGGDVAGGNPGQGELTLPDAGEVRKAISMLTALGVDESWSGMLPKPEYYKAYPKDVQERMCQWNDAFTIDESKRQDRLVDNEIKQANIGTWISAVLFLVSMVFSLVCFLKTGSGWSFGFLAVPVMSVLSNMLTPVFSRSSVHDSDKGSKKKAE